MASQPDSIARQHRGPAGSCSWTFCFQGNSEGCSACLHFTRPSLKSSSLNHSCSTDSKEWLRFPFPPSLWVIIMLILQKSKSSKISEEIYSNEGGIYKCLFFYIILNLWILSLKSTCLVISLTCTVWASDWVRLIAGATKTFLLNWMSQKDTVIKQMNSIHSGCI